MAYDPIVVRKSDRGHDAHRPPAFLAGKQVADQGKALARARAAQRRENAHQEELRKGMHEAMASVHMPRSGDPDEQLFAREAISGVAPEGRVRV